MTILNGNTIYLHGAVGDHGFDTNCFTSAEVVDALRALGSSSPVTVSINSEGGDYLDGVSIYNALKAHPGRVTCLVEGIALSAGSLIAMAGDEIAMRLGSLMMIHGCSSMAHGTISQLEAEIDLVRKINKSMAEIYARRTKRPIAEIERMLATDTWFSATEAVAAGFADRIAEDHAKLAASFDVERYKTAPAAVQEAMRRAKASASSGPSMAESMRKVLGMKPTASLPNPAAGPTMAESMRKVLAQQGKRT